MKNPITKQMVVTSQSGINSNQLVESVALFDEAGAPVVLGAGGGFELDGEFTYTIENLSGWNATKEVFDFADYITDTEGWYADDDLVLPTGTYLFNVSGQAQTVPTAEHDDWRIRLSFYNPDFINWQHIHIPGYPNLAEPNPSHVEFGEKKLIHLINPSAVFGAIVRPHTATLEGYFTVNLMIQKL